MRLRGPNRSDSEQGSDEALFDVPRFLLAERGISWRTDSRESLSNVPAGSAIAREHSSLATLGISAAGSDAR